jgi:hypothetical protein
VRRFNDRLDLVLVGLGQIGQLIDSLVPVWQREYVHQQIERGQEPGEDSISGEITVERGQFSRPVPREIEEAKTGVDGEREGNEIGRQGERDDSFGRPLGDSE